MVLTAVKRHSPQQICPQGVTVAFIGGEKQIGQVKAERGSGTGLLGAFSASVFRVDMTGESGTSITEAGSGPKSRCLPLPLLDIVGGAGK